MSVPVDCPHCGHSISISDEQYVAAKGKNAKCNKCHQPFIVKRAIPAEPEVILTAIPPTTVEEKDVWNATPSLWIGFRTYFWSGVLTLFCFLGAAFNRWMLLGFVLAAFIVVMRVLHIKSIRYHLTTERLRITSGILARRMIEIELFRIRDLSFEQSFIQRLLGMGTVKAISTDEDAKDVFLSGIKDAMKVKENLRKFVMKTRKATGTRDLDVASIGR